MGDLHEELSAFASSAPEVVFEWSDRESDARGWLVINSLHGGAAGGGTRMRLGLDRDEVAALAKTMEIKFTVSGPGIGGAKSGINFDPRDPRKKDVLARWFKAVTPILKTYYGTGGDLNVDEIRDVIPCIEQYGVVHPQEGVICGHFNPTEAQKIDKIGQLRRGVSLKVKGTDYTPTPIQFTVADLITGYGVAESIRHYYNLWGGDITTKTAAIQGWGNVGAAAAFYLAKMGAKIVAISDKDGGAYKEEGFTFEEVSELLKNKDGNVLKCFGKLTAEEINEKFWTSGASIFVPAAASRLISAENVAALIEGGVEVISCGANVPFQEEGMFLGPLTQEADQKTSLIPDFIANCGMARAFSYLMSDEADLSEEAIFADTSKTIENALLEIHNLGPDKTHLTARALEMALMKIRERQLSAQEMKRYATGAAR
ncbi:MAG: Glu/Leu/Phe/Val dehydrogenase [Bdellovibrionales bacterium]|nr:Glu/Leu/Phe/Val dehydrogenase [Bdellovibrionales bacterium]